MLNYAPTATAVPTSENYPIPNSAASKSPPLLKQVRRQEKVKRIYLDGYTFKTEELEVELEDVKNKEYNKFLSQAVKYIEAHAPQNLIKQALPFLRALNEKTVVFENADLPRFGVSFPEQGEMLLAWNFEHFTIALTFDSDASESSWHMVNDGTVRKTTAWGYLDSQSISDLMTMIAAQVVEDAPAG